MTTTRPLHVLIGGGSGFIGTALSSSLRHNGHKVTVLSTQPSTHPSTMTWTDLHTHGLPHSTNVVINLAGANIFKHVWTNSYKEQCVSSRVTTTTALAQAISCSPTPPSLWISTSAVGIYPPSVDTRYDEHSVIPSPTEDWASTLCTAVEHSATLSQPQTRSVILRMGIVLGKGGGAFGNMYLPFQFGLGGPFGTGDQWFPLVHLRDVVRAYEFVLKDERARGVLNVVAPNMCTNQQFVSALGECMGRPVVLPVPRIVGRIMGEDRGKMLFEGQHVSSVKWKEMGFEFRYPDVNSCCVELCE